MGWNVSHGSNQYGEERRSYTTIANLGKHLENCVSGSDWATLQQLFGRATGDPKSVTAQEAGRIATILRTAVTDRRMPANWGAEAALFADAASRAANANQLWTWR